MPPNEFGLQSSKNRDLPEIVQRTLIGEYGIRCSIKRSKGDRGDQLVVSRMNNVRKCLEIFTLMPLYGLKRWDFCLMEALFDEIISQKLHNTPSGAIIDLKSLGGRSPHTRTYVSRVASPAGLPRFGLAKGASRGAAASILQKIRDQWDDPPQLSAHFVTGLVESDRGLHIKCLSWLPSRESNIHRHRQLKGAARTSSAVFQRSEQVGSPEGRESPPRSTYAHICRRKRRRIYKVKHKHWAPAGRIGKAQCAAT